jgi:ribose transport system ATP-binding protein
MVPSTQPISPERIGTAAVDDLETIGLTKAFGGVVAVKDVNFVAKAGEIHALLGENGAGKSTFIKLIVGALRPDAGEVRIGGLPLEAGASRRRVGGVRAVFQELSLVPDLTVAENVWIGCEPRNRLGGVPRRAMERDTVDLFDELGLDVINPRREIRLLSVAERHIVETVKALATRPQVIIFDETTSALGPTETEWLVARARTLAAEGRIVLFISHRLAEVREVADRVTVFRGGENVGVRTRAEYDEDELVTLMLARKLERFYPDRDWQPGSTVSLRMRGLEDGHKLNGVDLDLHEGEILGIGGLQGQGQTQLFLSLYGVYPLRSGEVEIMGEPARIRSVRDALHGDVSLALVPEDRHRQGLLLTKSIRENVTLPVLNKVARFGVIDRGREKTVVDDVIKRFQIVARDQDQQVRWLSGGNQQKVLIAKYLLSDARILLLFDVTRGVDVGTKPQIFNFMRELAHQGYSVLFYSTDAAELVHMANRVAVIADGRVVATLEGSALTEERLLRAAVQGEHIV